MKTKVLIVEDDVDLGNLLKQYLEINNFDAQRVYNGEEARMELKNNPYDILIIDVMMPKEDGFTLAEKITQTYPELPFLFVTAKKMKEDILHGLKIGADDYIIKPFDADEVVLRIKNILKRSRNNVDKAPEHILIGTYLFDPSNLTLASAKTNKTLTEKESKLLLYLCQHQNQLIKRKSILDYLWDDSDFFNGRSMDVFISRLRKHLSEDPAIQIESIRGIGFRFHCP
jgi:DNA-binding response OmpR family regulator